MAKGSILNVRVDAAVKRRITDAARRARTSVTTLVLDAVMTSVERIEARPEPAPPKATGACPAFFRALCATATSGGAQNYHTAGYELARHLETLGPYNMNDRKWLGELKQLEQLKQTADVVAWFQRFLPRCIALVPKRRHEQFVKGVTDCIEAKRW